VVRIVKLFLGALIMIGAASAKPTQYIEPIDESVYQLFDVKYSTLESAGGETYKIFQAVPKNRNVYPKAIFMLDANAQFSVLLNLFKNFTSNDNVPLIIGVGYDTPLAYDTVRRTKDLTPLAQGDEYEQGGNADKFYKFIKERLMPFVDKEYDIKNSEKIFYGHSFGGLFLVYSLLQNGGIFDEFFIASPSLWWGDSKILKDALDGDGKLKLKLKASFIRLSVGELEKRAGKTDKENILKAADLAEILKKSGVKYEFKIYEGQGHGDVIPLVLKDIVKHVSK
jgi:iroE protein